MSTDPTGPPAQNDPLDPEPGLLGGSTGPVNTDAAASIGSADAASTGAVDAYTGSAAGDAPASAAIGSTTAPTPPASTPARDTGHRDPSDSSMAELLRTLTDNVRSIVQGEVANARQEMAEKARAAQPAAAMLGGAAVLGVLATGTSAAVVVRFLDKLFPPTTSAVLATALLGGGAAALGRAGLEELRRVGSLVPERTVESVKADVAAVTGAADAGRHTS